MRVTVEHQTNSNRWSVWLETEPAAWTGRGWMRREKIGEVMANSGQYQGYIYDNKGVPRLLSEGNSDESLEKSVERLLAELK